MGKGTLYLVATPIGNLEDITVRAKRILKEADVIAAEDTRHTVNLLNHLDIKNKLISFHEYSGQNKYDEILDMLEAGKTVALVSDAGTPLISDPGTELVRQAIAQGVDVVPIPGACAPILALIVSGLPIRRFCFEGFLPAKKEQRRKTITAFAQEQRTVVFLESPHRLLKTLADLNDILGEDRKMAVCREITKMYEEVFRGTIKEAREAFLKRSVKGEFVLVLDGAAPQPAEISEACIISAINQKIQNGETKKDAVLNTASELNLNKNKVYKISLKL